MINKTRTGVPLVIVLEHKDELPTVTPPKLNLLPPPKVLESSPTNHTSSPPGKQIIPIH